MIKRELQIAMRERLDADLTRLAIPGIWGNLGMIVVILLMTSLYRDAPRFSQCISGFCFIHCCVRLYLVLGRKRRFASSPLFWRSSMHCCLASGGALWGVVSAFAVGTYGYDHRNTAILLCSVITMAAGGINMLMADQKVSVFYLLLCFGPNAAVALYRDTPIAHAFFVSIIILFLYFFQQSRNLHFEYWRGLTDEWNLRLKSKELLTLAHHDSLTGLANRRRLKERAMELLNSPESARRGLALFYIDLDRFKEVNDVYSHRVGDLYLQAVASRISSEVKETEIVARIGGDEFLILLQGVPDARAAATRAESLLAQFQKPVVIDDHELAISASIGISLFPEQGNDLESLQKNADTALYRAKNSGRNRFEVFSAELSEKTRRAKSIESGLFRALGEGGLAVQYQPQFGLTGAVVGLEALCRLQLPQLGPVSPVEFIPVAEESGLIVPVGRWVLGEVCRQVMEWQSSGMRPVRVAVNVSVAQLTREDFVEEVGQILRRSGLDPCLLELELTESLLMLNLDAAARHMTDLRKLGVRFSIDDFGAGYSSLGYLHKLPIDLVKIDRCFVNDLDAEVSSRPVIESILALARNLRLGVIAEGVETIAQYSTLSGLGCAQFQGYLFAKPMSAPDVFNLISEKFSPEPIPASLPPEAMNDNATGDLVHLALHL